MEEYQRLEWIGSGTFGRVYRGISARTQSIVAIKCIPTTSSSINISSSMTSLISEIEAMSKTREHSNIIKYHGSIIKGNEVWIIMDYCACGSLRAFLEEEKGGNGLEEGAVIVIAEQVLEALRFLHERQIIHRDIKAANIMVDSNGKVKLGDFGVANISKSSTMVSSTTITKTTNTSIASNPQVIENHDSELVGSPYWMPPEMIKKHAPIDWHADIWSFGILLIELLTGSPPLADLSPQAAIQKIITEMPPTCPENVVAPEIRRVINLCLNDDPLKRPSASSLLHILKGSRYTDIKIWKQIWTCRLQETQQNNEHRSVSTLEDRKTLASEWTFGTTIDSSFTLKTWLEDESTFAQINSKRIIPPNLPGDQIISPTTITVSSNNLCPNNTTAMLPIKNHHMYFDDYHDHHSSSEYQPIAPKLPPRCLPNDSSEKSIHLRALVEAKKASCPHILFPSMDANSNNLFIVMMNNDRKQTKEQKEVSEKLDNMVKKLGINEAALEYYKNGL